MSAPHVHSDPAMSAAFRAKVERDPYGAVRLAHARGFRVDEADVPVPYSAQLEALPKVMQGDFRLDHAAELQNERAARMLARRSDVILAARASAVSTQTAADRETRIAKRAAELEAEDLAARRAAWRTRAEAEIEGAAPPAHDTTTPRTKASRATERKVS